MIAAVDTFETNAAALSPMQNNENVRAKKTLKTNSVMIACLVLAFCLISSAGAASIETRREIAPITDESTSAAPSHKVCHQNTPCGWAIYIPFTRRIDYFMRNTCECSPNLACLKTDDDLSVNAYVYRCKARSAVTSTDVDLPSTAI